MEAILKNIEVRMQKVTSFDSEGKPLEKETLQQCRFDITPELRTTVFLTLLPTGDSRSITYAMYLGTHQWDEDHDNLANQISAGFNVRRLADAHVYLGRTLDPEVHAKLKAPDLPTVVEGIRGVMPVILNSNDGIIGATVTIPERNRNGEPNVTKLENDRWVCDTVVFPGEGKATTEVQW
jgi:hypothetical protein